MDPSAFAGGAIPRRAIAANAVIAMSRFMPILCSSRFTARVLAEQQNNCGRT